jgi:hypothetical protein
MSFTKVIANTMAGSFKLVTSRIVPRQGVKLRETKIAVLQDLRFTKDQAANLKAHTESTKSRAS